MRIAVVWTVLTILLLLFPAPAESQSLAVACVMSTHDPSRITKCHGKYFLYSTGIDCPMQCSTDLMHWSRGPNVLSQVPKWARAAVPAAIDNTIWAPDVLYANGCYNLYYSYSTFGSKVSVIGLVTSPTLDPSDSSYRWTDRGEVIRSTIANDYNAIDPCPFRDKRRHLWLSFGSWNAGGIELVRLDDKTGLPASRPVSLATGRGRLGPEASFILYHHGYYYLWDNEGWCCRGVKSTYHILVSRSRQITGPYLDKDGEPMLGSGASVFLQTQVSQIGPGCIGIAHLSGRDYASYHYYNGRENGRPTLAIAIMSWDTEGWPRLASR